MYPYMRTQSFRVPNQMPPYPFATPFSRNVPPLPVNESKSLDDYLVVADKILQRIQQFQPIMKQATPLVQQLPTLLKLFNQLPSSTPNIPTSTVTSSVPRIFQPPSSF